MSGIITELLRDASSDSKKKERLAKAEYDFFYFCKTYLPHYFSSAPAPYHEILIDIANTHSLTQAHIEALQAFMHEQYHELLIPTNDMKSIVDIEPRGFSKTVRWGLAYPLWRVLFRKNKFVCIFGASQGMANTAIQNIKYELEDNEHITADFGELQGDIWKNDFLVLKNGTAIAGKGSGGSVRGIRYREHRPDLIICDDILKDENAKTHAQREKIAQWFSRAILPLGRDVFIILINTLFHSDDLPSRLLNRIQKQELPRWVGLRFSAFVPGGESLWPAYWPKEKLEAKKKEIGSAAFSTEYMNEPLSDEERVFKPEWFIRYHTVDITTLRTFMGVDPSAGKHDEFAIFTLGIAPDNMLYELDEWGECCSVDTAVQKLIEKHLIFKPILIGFEEVGFQAIYKQHIMDVSSKQGIYLPIKGIATRGIGKERILSLSPLVENGFFRFKENHNKTIDQLVMYPKSEFDDLGDACYYAWEVSQNSKSEVFAFSVRGSPSRLQAALHRFRGR